MTAVWDYVIVGGGSAGCVLANRLSARPDRSVLLIEAGRDFPPGTEPPELLDGYSFRAAFDPAYQWPELAVHLRPVPHNGTVPPLRHYAQGRVIGGTSSINGQQANRGLPADYDEWAAQGAPGWAWADVLPYFRRLERDLDFDGPLHGSDGPIAISRIPRAQWPGFSHAVADALAARGVREIADQNAEFDDGWFAMAVSNDGEHRVSASAGYLDAATRRRPNLRVAAETTLRAIRFEGRRAVGVTVMHGGRNERIAAREIVVAAGALHSPAILMRAGIGPAAALRALDVTVIADRPGVGGNLNEHAAISLSAYVRRGARLGKSPRRHIHCAWRYSSLLPGCPAADMYMVAVAKSAWHPVGRRLGSLFAWINKPFSRGRVALAAAAPEAPPRVAFELLRDQRDLDRLVEAVRRMAAVFASSPLAAVTDAPFASSLSGLARAVNAVALRNWLLTMPPALALDGPAPLRRALIGRVLAPGAPLAALLADDAALEDHVRRNVAPGWHASGTCRMGPGGDPDAVVDPRDGRVHGVGGLRVVDASVMPAVPRANTNIPTLMIAEKMADAIAAADAAASPVTSSVRSFAAPGVADR